MKFSPGQILRILIGIAILILIGSVYLPHLFFAYSTNSVVTGRLIILTSPIEGFVTQAPPPMGTELRKGDVIAVIENPTVDLQSLTALETDQRSLDGRLQSLKRERESLTVLYQRLDETDKQYRTYLKSRVEKEIEKAKYHEQELSATLKQNKNQLKREKSLFSQHFTSKSKLDDATFSNERSINAVEQAQMEEERLLNDLNALRSGVFVTPDGRADVPYHQQRKDDITLRLATLDTQMEETTARLDTLNARVIAEQERINQLKKTSLISQKPTVVMRGIATQGSHIDAKTPVVELVDCSSVFVDMTIHERFAGKIRPGDKATISIIGTKKPIIGTVTAVRGGSMRPDAETSLAGVTLIRRQRDIEIMIAFDIADLEREEGDFCYVGRTAEVSFSGLKTLF